MGMLCRPATCAAPMLHDCRIAIQHVRTQQCLKHHNSLSLSLQL